MQNGVLLTFKRGVRVKQQDIGPMLRIKDGVKRRETEAAGRDNMLQDFDMELKQRTTLVAQGRNKSEPRPFQDG